MLSSQGIHVLARGIIIHTNKILVAVNIGTRHYSFLPGGHVEHGESAPEALKRELLEETGIQADIGPCAGILESTWNNNGSLFHEINLIYWTSISSVTSNENPNSRESHVRFTWVALDKLDEAILLPESLCNIIPAWVKQKTTADFFSDMMS